MPLKSSEAACAEARALGLATHLDGARLFNGCAAGGYTPEQFCAPYDTVSICLSKGLGAPIGSVLLGSRDRIDLARHYRKLYGGGWRQAGLLAAAGLHALKSHTERLREDHEVAAELADGLGDLGFDVIPPETNMVWCAPPKELGDFSGTSRRLAEEEGILVGSAYGGPAGRHPCADARMALRFVTHLQAGRPAVRALLSGLTRMLRR